MHKGIFSMLIAGVLAFTPGAKVSAQAYVYIQSDKSLPFYVRINGAMQQRYSKYYCIAPKLKPGKTEVEILFQQNAWPAQKFMIDVPATGKCGFILNKEGDNFSLYDLETKNKIAPLKEDNNK